MKGKEVPHIIEQEQSGFNIIVTEIESDILDMLDFINMTTTRYGGYSYG